MDGFVVIDKPKGISSFDVVRLLRQASRERKIGHCGTLDPMATGVLVCALGQGTKLIEYLLNGEKKYRAEIEFAKRSDTFDLEGEIESVSLPKDFIVPDWGRVENLLAEKFSGKIKQLPPKFSALKINGKRACDLVREGKEVEMKPREVEILQTEVVEFEWPRLVLDVHCGKGTYIRSLANDLGDELGCGAVLAGLRRTRVSDFDLNQAKEIKFEKIEMEDGFVKVRSQNDESDIVNWLLPIETGVGFMTKIELSADEVEGFFQGKFLVREGGWGVEGEVGEVVAGMVSGKLVGVLEFREIGVLKLKKGIVK